LPLRADLGQVIDEVVGGAGTVGAVHDVDLGRRQRHAGVDRGDLRVVPGGDLAEEDVGEDRAGQAQLAAADAFDVDHRDHAADRGRELGQARGGQLAAGQRLVGGAEIDGAGLDLGDAAAGTDRLVVDLVPGGLVVVVRPLGDQRIDEGRARAGDFGGNAVACDCGGALGGV